MNKQLQVLYFHGLGSNGNGSTVQGLRALGCNVIAPDYRPHHFQESMEQVLAKQLGGSEQLNIVVGTSMGGFYALKAAELYDVPVLAINPCIDPATMLEKYLNAPAYDYANDQPLPITQAMLDQFEGLEPTAIRAGGGVIIGDNDDVIPPASVQAFCEQYGLITVHTDWGHRVGDVNRLYIEMLKFLMSLRR